MKLYKDYTKEPYLFTWMTQIYHHIIHYDLGRTYYKNDLVRKSKQSITRRSKTKLNTI